MKFKCKKISTQLIGATILLTLPTLSMAIGKCAQLAIDFSVAANAPNCQLEDILIKDGRLIKGSIPKVITQQNSRLILEQYMPTTNPSIIVKPNLKVRYRCGAVSYTISSRQAESGMLVGAGKVRGSINPNHSGIKPKISKGKCPVFRRGSAGHISWVLTE